MPTTEHDPTDDELLAIRCQLGEAAAFDDLIARWHGPLWSFVRRLVGEDDAAREIFQDVWVRVIRGIPRLRDGSKLRAWLFGIARRTLMDRLREEYARSPIVDVDVDEIPADARRPRTRGSAGARARPGGSHRRAGSADAVLSPGAVAQRSRRSVEGSRGNDQIAPVPRQTAAPAGHDRTRCTSMTHHTPRLHWSMTSAGSRHRSCLARRDGLRRLAAGGVDDDRNRDRVVAHRAVTAAAGIDRARRPGGDRPELDGVRVVGADAQADPAGPSSGRGRPHGGRVQRACSASARWRWDMRRRAGRRSRRPRWAWSCS